MENKYVKFSIPTKSECHSPDIGEDIIMHKNIKNSAYFN